MALTPQQQEIAETLIRAWSAKKEMNCYRRQLCRVAEALDTLSKSIRAELGGEANHPLVKCVRSSQSFTVDPVNRVAGGGDMHDLPTADELARLTDSYRSACQSDEDSKLAASQL